MSLTIQLTPGYLFQDADELTPDILRAIARPNIKLLGTLGTLDLADGGVTTVKLADGVLSADESGRAKMTNGYIVLDFLSAGMFTADTAGRAPFATGFVDNYLLDEATREGCGLYGAATLVATTYVVTLAPAPAAYTAGMEVRFKANAANAGTVSLNVNSLGAVAIYKNVNQALNANDILAGQIVRVIYDGTNFQLQPILKPVSTTLQIKFNGTPTSKTITNTVDTVNNQLTVTGHGMLTGQCCSLRNSSGALPTSSPTLAANTAYYVRVVDTNTIALYSTYADAINNTNVVDLTGNGSGTNTLDYITPITNYGCDVIESSSGGSLLPGQYLVVFQTNQANAHYLVQALAKAADTSHVSLVNINSTDAASNGKVGIICASASVGGSPVISVVNLAEVHVTITPAT